MMSRTPAPAALLSICLVLAGCAGAPELQRARELGTAGRAEEALATLQAGAQRSPDNLELRAALARQKEVTLSQWTIEADAASLQRRTDAARSLYERVLGIDPGNRRALAGMELLGLRAQADQRVAQAEASFAQGRVAEAEAALRAVLVQDSGHAGARRALARLREKQLNAETLPTALQGALASPITLELRDMPLRNAFEVIARSAQINFVFDRDVRADARVTLTVRNSPVQDVIRLLLLTQQLDRRILNTNSMLIYPATPAKQREYQELSTRVFFLSNAEAKQAQGILKSLGKIKEVHIDEKLNMVAVRDTPDAVRLAERLIESIDIAEPEVMMEVEVLEISHTKARNLGIQFPDEVRVESLLPLSNLVPSGRIDTRSPQLVATIANPALRIGLQSSDTDVNLLANPRIRAKNHEKAKVLIGEKLPVFTTTAVQNAGVASSVSYLDVGLKLEVEPNVFLDDEVGIKVSLEVNTNLERITSIDGSTAFRLGTRTAQTNLRLRDGETAVLAGLINHNDRDTLAKLPGLGDVPGIGRAFGNTNRQIEKSEIVLLITPRVLRNIAPPLASSLMLSSGTEAANGAPPLTLAATAPRALAMPLGANRGPSAAATAAGAAPSEPAAAAEAGSPTTTPDTFTARLLVPADVSIGREMTLQVEVSDAAAAQSGEAIVAFDASLLSDGRGGSGGRAVVNLAPGGAPGVLTGSLSLRAAAAGSGQTSVEVVGGSVRLHDGQQRPLSGSAASLRIGL